MESTLSLTLDDLSGDVGFFLGYGRGANNGETAWTTQQQAAVTSCVKSGMRQFYYPPPLMGETSSYNWSFIKPIGLISFLTGAQVVQLPDDFGGIEGQIHILGNSSVQVPWPIPVVGEGSIRQAYAISPTRTGKPEMVAIIPTRPISSGQGQRFQLYIFPLSDGNYTFQVPYYLNPDYLTGAAPYPLGGMQHAETVREACLMAAENFLDDGSTIHAMKFQERLAASISSDRRLKPQLVGYNGDRSDLKHLGADRTGLHYLNYGGIKVGGIQY